MRDPEGDWDTQRERDRERKRERERDIERDIERERDFPQRIMITMR